MEVITGAGKGAAKTQIVKDFAPKANNVSGTPNNPIQLLISTDVLSEGQNLQDCGYLINYDLHFNPVRMIQRNGRIDRLFSAHKVVTVANFFPEGELEQQLDRSAPRRQDRTDSIHHAHRHQRHRRSRPAFQPGRYQTRPPET